MNTAMWWMGAIVGFGGALFVLTMIVFGCLQMADNVLMRAYSRGREEGLLYVKRKLHSASWWFSEDEPTRNLLADLAELSEWDARARWRKARSLPAASEEPKP